MASAWKEPRYRTATVLIVIACTLYVYFVRRHHPSLNPRENGFTPEAAQKLMLDTGAAKYTYLRVDAAHPWEPAVEPKLIERPLKVLATTATGKMQPAAAGMTFLVGFGGTQIWSGLYGEGKFVWQEGEMEGLGFEVKGDAQDVMEEASFAFVPHVWNWCPSKPKQISITGPDVSIVLERGKKGWVGVKSVKVAKVDSKAIDNWLLQSCRVTVDYFKDLERYPLPPTLVPQGTFSVSPEGSDSLIATKINDYWKLDDRTAFKSQMLVMQLTKLQELVK